MAQLVCGVFDCVPDCGVALRISATSGVFDLVHPGHLNLLRKCAELGDYVVVFLNSDSSVKKNKGNDRPIHNEKERKAILEAIRYVDEVVVFQEKTPEKAILTFMRTINYYVKTDEYKNHLPEKRFVDNVVFIKKDKHSTTNIIKNLT